ncbi:MAG: cobyrinate a,c-diamide synthase [Desulfopila sp.]
MQSKGIMVAGLAGGSGKSVVSVGLTAAFAARGDRVVPFKKGPDYIDAGWLQLAAGRQCYNLDPYLVAAEHLQESFFHHSQEADIALLEGNRGLYDGVTADGGYSTADLAILLDMPVLLVVNCQKITRTVAAMVLGCMHLDPRVRICGVVLNSVATERQRRLIIEAVERYTGLPVVGAIPRMSRDIFPMRHLGMVPYQEYTDSGGALRFLVDTVRDNLDLARIEALMTKFSPRPSPALAIAPAAEPVRIGILRDAAFQFYYAENLEALRRAGAELVTIDALEDEALPELAGLYIGGGFPETSARGLAANRRFRESIRQAAMGGLPIYAECGGLIYLGESIVLEGEEYPLTGIFPIRFGMAKKPQAHGYSEFVVTGANPFYALGQRVKGHEFRYSTVLSWQRQEMAMALTMTRGRGFAQQQDGLVYNNVLAMYTHVLATGTPQWATGLVGCCRRYAAGQKA